MLRADAEYVIGRAIAAMKPEAAVSRALADRVFPGRVILVSVGKAGWTMAKAACDALGDRISSGAVLTKYGHVGSPLPGVRCMEAGHPVPDGRGVAGTEAILDMTASLRADDTVLFLLSGGASALFEKPLIPLEALQRITDQLLAAGCDIGEINTVRKRLSAVKGGKFAMHCAPAHVVTLVLSDVLGDRLDMIASGPTVPDRSTCGEALDIVSRYRIHLPEDALRFLSVETPRALLDGEAEIIGNVGGLCAAAAQACRERGYEPVLLTDRLCCEARDAGSFLASILSAHARDGRKTAWLAGGETVVHLSGSGLGGRNQELALAAAAGIAGLPNAALISVGSDGTDGPTDAAGGYADGGTLDRLAAQGLSYIRMLDNHDSYHALQAAGGLIITGATGTNVNDVTVGLIG